jgi:carboxypeptidase C (cathepsin A)
MADENTPDEKPDAKADHKPPAGAETTATWTGGETPIDYTASAKWLVLRKKEKPAAEIFSVSYVAKGGDADRPVMFVFNGGPGASSAYLHLGAVGPQRVAFPADGTLPQMPPHLEQNAESWLAFTDLVFVDPVGTGFSRIVEDEQKDGASEDKKKDNANDPKEYFGYKRDLESLCEFMSRWLSSEDRWGSPVFIAGESYGGYRVGRLVRMLQETAGIGLNGAILISPALESRRSPRATMTWSGGSTCCPRWLRRQRITGAHGHSLRELRSTTSCAKPRCSPPATTRHSSLAAPRCRRTNAIAFFPVSPISSGFLRISSPAPRVESRTVCSHASCSVMSGRCSASTTQQSR